MSKLTDKEKLRIIHGLEAEIRSSVKRAMNSTSDDSPVNTKLQFDDLKWDPMDKLWMSDILEHHGIEFEFV